MGVAESPLISLIVSCYNHEQFVAEAIGGVLSQTYRPLEIIILDDCSTDRTADIVRAKLAERPDRLDIRLVRNPVNVGTRGNLQRGISLTTGAFIAVACGDDILGAEAVSEVARVWREENVTLVAANADYIDADSQPLGRTYRDPQGRADDSFETIARDGVNACCFGPFLCFERELYDTFGCPAELEVFDIIAPFYAYLLKGARFIDKPLIKYRVHGGNTSHSLIAERLSGIDRLSAEEHMKSIHLAHAVHARDTVLRLSNEQPERYQEVKDRIWPLLDIWLWESARKFANARAELNRMRRATEKQAIGRNRLGRSIAKFIRQLKGR
jgi:glycosyltransferase involved in cell wall biosynthesis